MLCICILSYPDFLSFLIEGQAQPVDLVAALHVNMHRLPPSTESSARTDPSTESSARTDPSCSTQLDPQNPALGIANRQAPKTEEMHGDIVPSDSSKAPAGFQTHPGADIAPTT